METTETNTPETTAPETTGGMTDAPAPPLPKRRGRPPGSKNKPKDANGNAIESGPDSKPKAPEEKPTEWPVPSPEAVAFFQSQMTMGARMLGQNFGPHWAMQINPATGDARALTEADFKMPAYALAQIAGDKLANPWVVLIGFAMMYAVPNAIISVKLFQEAKKQEASSLASAQPVSGGAPSIAVGGE